MYLITKDFAFSAAHRLDGLPAGHKCGRLHGHNYIVRVQISAGRLDPTGFVLDYGALAPFSQWIDQHLDHRMLNDELPALGGPSQPSAEHMAAWFVQVLRGLDLLGLPVSSRLAVGVSETPKTWAWFEEEDYPA